MDLNIDELPKHPSISLKVLGIYISIIKFKFVLLVSPTSS